MEFEGRTRHVSASQLARLLGGPPAERPAYRTLAHGVRDLVRDGRVAVPVRLPAERDLAAALGLSRTTVTAAYDLLREKGFARSRRGAGTWTAMPPSRFGPPLAAGARPGAAEDPAAPIDLGCAAPPAPPGFAEAVEAAVARLPEHTGGPGYEPAGLWALRDVVADRYTRRGVPTRPDQILVTGGAQHALSMLFQVLLEPGTPVLAERPAYPHTLGALRSRQARVVPFGVTEGWDVELMGSAIRQSAARLVCLIPDFQNPTGHLMDTATRAALAETAARTDALLLTDESFAELALEAAPEGAPLPPPLAAFGGDRVISVGSTSKLLWGGLRVGWIRASAALVRRLADARSSIDIAGPVLEQLIAVELLHRVEEVRAERVAELVPRRDALAAALRERLPGWRFRTPAGGMCLWARIDPEPGATALAEVADRHGVLLVPGPEFGGAGVGEDRVRLPYVLPPDTLREAVDRLASAVGELAAAPARPRSRGPRAYV